MADDVRRELEARLRELDAINAIGRSLTSSLELRAVLETIMARVDDLLGPRQAALLLVDEQRADLVFEVARGEGAERLVGLRVAPGEGIVGWVAREQQSVLVADVSADARFAGRFDRVSKTTTRSILAVPLVARGRTLGVIELINGLRDRPFVEDDVRLARLLAEFAAIGVENARHYRKIEELTIVDEHTSLFNARYLRRTLEVEVERARRFGHPLSVIFFDLDKFKAVNDTHGHGAGSALLAEVADLLVGSLRTVDVPVRYGGDEFVVVLPETLKQAAVDVAGRVHAALGRYVFLRQKGLRVHITGSFGVAAFPEDATTAEDLLRVADEAMYEVKNASRDGIAVAGWGLL